MNKVDVNLWLLVLHKDNKTELMNHSYEFEYSKDELTELFLNKYNYYPLNLILDKRYRNDFGFIDSTEDLQSITYKTLDIGVNYIKINDKIIYEGDIKDENNK